MTVALIIYALAVSTLLTAGAWIVDRLLRGARIPTRFAWIAAMVATVLLVAIAPMRASSAATDATRPVLLTAIDVLAMDAAVSGATDAAQRWLPTWSGSALLAAWAMLSLLTALYFVAGAVRHRRVLGAARVASVDGTSVRISDEFGPAVIGLRRPTVVLPRWLLGRSAAEQRLVVAHEREHIAVRDPLLLLVGIVTVVAIPWNALLWWGFTRLRLAMELDCDARVLRAGALPLAYGSLLLDLTAALPPSRFGAPAFAARPSQLEQRILAMSTRHATPRRRAITIIASVATIALTTIAACTADVSEPRVEATRPLPPSITVGAPGSASTSDLIFFDFQVEKTAQPVAGAGTVRYPAILRSAEIGGEVLAQFVVDTLGRVEIGSYKTVRKTHDLFDQAVREALPAMRFTPAEVGGNKVRQLVQTPFVFQLAK